MGGWSGPCEHAIGVSLLVLGLASGAEAQRRNVTVKGCDTMVLLGQRWAENDMKKSSGVVIQVTGGGSGTGIAAPTVEISSGTATFSVAQPDKVGVGDVITYNRSTKAYISGRTSSTVYSVTTATGAAPPNVTSATLNSIQRAFNSLSAAQTGSSDVNHLNTTDLVTGNLQLHWTTTGR